MRSALAVLAVILCACSGSAKVSLDGGGDDGGTTDGGDPCATPPAGVCLDATTLQASRTPGTPSNGTCSFETFTSTCPFGCANGACQAEVCAPSCPAATCGDDACGGTCGACTSGTTFPGLSATQLGIAHDVKAAPDGIHLAAIRALQPLPPNCGFAATQVGSLDVWTVPATGAATHRTIGAHVGAFSTTFTDDNYLVYVDNANPCTATGDLWVARADGSQPHLIATKIAQTFQVIKGTVFFEVRDLADPTPSDYDGFVYAARLPDGAPKKIANVHFNSFWVPSPAGDAIWINFNPNVRDLTIRRIDGTASPVATSPAGYTGFPVWSPDGKQLAYGVTTTGITAELHVINSDGTGHAVLSNDCQCFSFSNSIVWSADASRIAWLVRPVAFGLDAHVHTFAGGLDVVLTGAVSPTTGGTVGKMTFSADNTHLYVASGNDQTGYNMMSAPIATSGAMTVVAPSFLGDTWTESANGAVLAVLGPGATRVITLGGATQTITGVPGGVALEPVTGAPRWLIQHGPTLTVYPLAGTGTGTSLPAFSTDFSLSDWAGGRNIPFVFGWSGSTALFPAAPNKVDSLTVTQDLMAWTTAATGRLGKLVTHYRPAAATARVYFTTTDDGLFWVARP